MYSEKAAKFWEIFPLLLTAVHTVKSKGKISQKVVAFSEYMNFNNVMKQKLDEIFWQQITKLQMQYKWVNKEQLGHSEPFPRTNMPVYLINSEQISIIEVLFDDQKKSYSQVWLYFWNSCSF